MYDLTAAPIRGSTSGYFNKQSPAEKDSDWSQLKTAVDWSHQTSFSITTFLLVLYISGINLGNPNNSILFKDKLAAVLHILWADPKVWPTAHIMSHPLALCLNQLPHMKAFAKETASLGLWWEMSLEDEKQLQKTDNESAKWAQVLNSSADGWDPSHCQWISLAVQSQSVKIYRRTQPSFSRLIGLLIIAVP